MDGRNGDTRAGSVLDWLRFPIIGFFFFFFFLLVCAHCTALTMLAPATRTVGDEDWERSLRIDSTLVALATDL